MTEQEQRIAIAEACGFERNPTWLPIDDYPAEFAKGNAGCYLSYNTVNELPNYPQDLNAMHEAEKVLTKEQMLEYVLTLGQVVRNAKAPKSSVDSFYFHATASQRAEALLKTIGKWKEV